MVRLYFVRIRAKYGGLYLERVGAAAALAVSMAPGLAGRLQLLV